MGISDQFFAFWSFLSSSWEHLDLGTVNFYTDVCRSYKFRAWLSSPWTLIERWSLCPLLLTLDLWLLDTNKVENNLDQKLLWEVMLGDFSGWVIADLAPPTLLLCGFLSSGSSNLLSEPHCLLLKAQATCRSHVQVFRLTTWSWVWSLRSF